MKKTKFNVSVVLLLLFISILVSSCGGIPKIEKKKDTSSENITQGQDTPTESKALTQNTPENGNPSVIKGDIKKEIIGCWALIKVTKNEKTTETTDKDNPQVLYSFTEDKATFYYYNEPFDCTYKWIDDGTIEITQLPRENVETGNKTISEIKIEGDTMYMLSTNSEQEQSSEVLERYSGAVPTKKN